MISFFVLGLKNLWNVDIQIQRQYILFELQRKILSRYEQYYLLLPLYSL